MDPRHTPDPGATETAGDKPRAARNPARGFPENEGLDVPRKRIDARDAETQDVERAAEQRGRTA